MLRKTRRCTFAGIWGEHTAGSRGARWGDARPSIKLSYLLRGKICEACVSTHNA